MPIATDIQKQLQKLKNPAKAKILSGFFKTGKGQYGEGDIFLGITVPEQRKVAKQFSPLSLSEVKKLLQSKIHEERLVALLILVDQFKKGTIEQKQKIYDFYLKHTKYINNWDLVDLSADKIVGAYMLEHGIDTQLLTKLAESKHLWDRRIAMIATLAFIRAKNFAETQRLAKLLLKDTHDLMHKAVGWMLREMGKRDEVPLRKFLNQYAHRLPRTALRYAIERLSPEDRAFYMKKK